MKSQYQSNCIILKGVTAVGMIVINVEEFDSAPRWLVVVTTPGTVLMVDWPGAADRFGL